MDAILHSLGLAGLSALFAAEDIDASVLPSLQDSDLREIGLTLGQRKKLLSYLQKNLSTAEPKAPQTGLPEPELRRLSVLFCDLVGYTEMTSRYDPDDMRGVLDQYYATARQAAETFGGHVAGFQGDGVLLIFGYPATREGIAGRAVGAAHALIAALPGVVHGMKDASISVRIGIASGRAIVGYPAGGAELQMVGPVVNRAARLQTVAEPGMIVVDDATRQQAAVGFAFTALPSARLKGIEGLVEVFQAQPPEGPSAPPDPPKAAPKSAHEAEAATLAAAWPPASDRPILVVLTGEAGIGKSTLLAQVAAGIAGQGADMLRLSCSTLSSQTPLRPVIDLIDGLLAQSADPRRTALARLLAPASPEETTAVALAMGLATQDPWDNTSSQDNRRLLLQALARFLIGKGPRLVLVEDVHWADPTTRALLQACAGLAAPGGAMFIATSRTGDEGLWADIPGRIQMPLDPLPPKAAHAVLRRYLDGLVLPEKVIQSILARSDGNPLMIEAQARTLAARADLALGQAFEVPSSIYECLSAQLEGLQQGRNLAAALAVFDAPTELSALGQTLRASEASLDDAVIELVKAGIVEVPEAARPTLRFRHNLYREVCYERLVKSNREKLHLSAFRVLTETLADAETLQPGLMAMHAQEGGDHAKAAPLAIAAGEQAMQRSALIEAGHFFGRAAQALDQLPSSRPNDQLRLKVLLAQASIARARQGIASDQVGEIGAQVLTLSRTLGDTRSELVALNGLYAHALVRADYPAARIWAERLHDIAQGAQDQTFQMIAERGLGVVAFHTGELATGAELLRQALDSYDEARHLPLAYLHGYDHAEICSVFLSMTLWISGDLAGAAKAGAFAVSHSRKISHFHSLAQALVFQSMQAALAGHVEHCVILAGEAEAVAAKQGLGAMLGVARFFDLLGRLMALDRPPTGAELAALHARWDEFKRSNPYNYIAASGALLASVCLLGGALDQAEAVLDEAARVQDQTGEIFAGPELLRQRARLLAAKHEAEAAEATVTAAVELAERMGAGVFLLRLACDRAIADPSPVALAEIRQAMERLASTDDGWDVRRAQALLLAGAQA